MSSRKTEELASQAISLLSQLPSRPFFTPFVLGLKNPVQELKDVIDALIVEYENEKKQLITSMIALSEFQVKRHAESIKEVKTELETCQNENKELKLQLEILEREKIDYDKQIKRYEELISEVKTELVECQNENKEFKLQVEILEEKLNIKNVRMRLSSVNQDDIDNNRQDEQIQKLDELKKELEDLYKVFRALQNKTSTSDLISNYLKIITDKYPLETSLLPYYELVLLTLSYINDKIGCSSVEQFLRWLGFILFLLIPLILYICKYSKFGSQNSDNTKGYILNGSKWFHYKDILPNIFILLLLLLLINNKPISCYVDSYIIHTIVIIFLIFSATLIKLFGTKEMKTSENFKPLNSNEE